MFYEVDSTRHFPGLALLSRPAAVSEWVAWIVHTGRLPAKVRDRGMVKRCRLLVGTSNIHSWRCSYSGCFAVVALQRH